MQLENGPAATCLCDIQEQQKQSRMDSGYKKMLLFSSSRVEPKMSLWVFAHIHAKIYLLG